MKLILIDTILLMFILSSCNQAQNDKEETQSPGTQTDTIKNETVKDTDSTRELTEFIPDGHEILDMKRGDLNNDKIEDVLLVLKAINEEETFDVSNPTARPLLILIRQPDNSLKLARKNNKTVYCFDCGGIMGDPYTGLTIKDNYFSIEHYGGSSWRWTKIITYKFDEDDQEWYLHKVSGVYFYLHDEDNTKEETVVTTKDFGIIKFEDYDIYEEKNSNK